MWRKLWISFNMCLSKIIFERAKFTKYMYGELRLSWVELSICMFFVRVMMVVKRPRYDLNYNLETVTTWSFSIYNSIWCSGRLYLDGIYFVCHGALNTLLVFEIKKRNKSIRDKTPIWFHSVLRHSFSIEFKIQFFVSNNRSEHKQ